MILLRLLSWGWLGVVLIVWLTFRRVGVLPRVRPLAVLPGLSVVIAARNEAQALRVHLPALLAQQYPGELQIIVVNDRSSDETGTVLQSAGVEVVHVQELPEGWLGKCHALCLGAARARGEWLLFLDADVALAPGSLARAVSAAVKGGWDHLPCCPKLILKSVWEQLFIVYFHIAFGIRYLPGHVSLRTPWLFAGVGAFNLIRRSVYAAVGGHEGLRLEVVDDMELGRRVKRAGFKQRFFAAFEEIQVHWFSGLGGLFRGLEKNAFAGQGYSVALSTFLLVLTVIVSLAPLRLMARGELAGWIPWLCVTLFCLRNRACVGHAAWPCWLWPLGGLLTAAALAYSMTVTLWRGGVRWRDTFYPLADLTR